MGVPSQAFHSAEAFLDQYRGEPGCLVVDLRLPGLSGLELQEELRDRGLPIPVVLITANARTAIVVRAMRSGAVTVLDKPCDEEALWEAIRDGLTRDRIQREQHAAREELSRQIGALSPSELEVLHRVVEGVANKDIARELGASVRTIENRRHSVFTKLGVHSLAELVSRYHEAKDAGILP